MGSEIKQYAAQEKSALKCKKCEADGPKYATDAQAHNCHTWAELTAWAEANGYGDATDSEACAAFVKALPLIGVMADEMTVLDRACRLLDGAGLYSESDRNKSACCETRDALRAIIRRLAAATAKEVPDEC